MTADPLISIWLAVAMTILSVGYLGYTVHLFILYIRALRAYDRAWREMIDAARACIKDRAP